MKTYDKYAFELLIAAEKGKRVLSANLDKRGNLTYRDVDIYDFHAFLRKGWANTKHGVTMYSEGSICILGSELTPEQYNFHFQYTSGIRLKDIINKILYTLTTNYNYQSSIFETYLDNGKDFGLCDIGVEMAIKHVKEWDYKNVVIALDYEGDILITEHSLTPHQIQEQLLGKVK